MAIKHREYGSKLFYNNQNGNIIHFVPDVKGHICEQFRPDKEWVSKQYLIDVNKIGALEFGYKSFEERVKNVQLLTVDPKRKQLILSEEGGYFTIHYNSQEEKHEYTLEQVNNFYHQHYVDFNLKQIFQCNDFTLEWIELDKLEVRDEILNLSWVNYFDDQYITDSSKDRTLLAREILNNGTYWPIVAQKVSYEDKYIVWEGNHRIISCKLAQGEGLLSNRKFLTMVIHEDINDIKEPKGIQKLLESPLRVRAPYICKFYDLGYPNDENSELVNKIMHERDMVYIDEEKEIVEYTVYTYTELLLATQIFPHWLKDVFYDMNKKEHGIKGSPIINNESAYDQWSKVYV